jgi:hypothetical protein
VRSLKKLVTNNVFIVNVSPLILLEKADLPEIKKLTQVGLRIDPELLKKVYQKIGE